MSTRRSGGLGTGRRSSAHRGRTISQGQRRSSAYKSPAARRRRRQQHLIRALALWAVCIILVILIASGTVNLVRSLASSKKRGFREDGMEKLAAADYTGAIEAFEQALEAAGEKDKSFNEDVLQYRAEAELMLKDYQAALHTYDLLAEMEPENLSYQYMRSICYGRQGDADQAVSIFTEAKNKDKAGEWTAGYEEALTTAGGACVAGEQYEKAMSLYEDALKDGTVNGEIYNQMGLCQMAEEDYEGALDSFNKGWDQVTTQYNAGSGAGLSQALTAVGEENQGDRELLKELSYNKAVAAEYLQDYDSALQQFETYIEVFGPDEDAQHEIDFLKTR